MDLVSFITTESGKDLILSFAIVDPHDRTGIDSLTLLRTPVYEHLLPPHERGVQVSFDRDAEDKHDLLEEVRWNKDTAVLELETQLKTYTLDLSKIDDGSRSRMHTLLKTMNHDGFIQMFGV